MLRDRLRVLGLQGVSSCCDSGCIEQKGKGKEKRKKEKIKVLGLEFRLRV